LLKESHIPELSLERRKPADLGKANSFALAAILSVIMKVQLVRQQYVL